MTAASMKYDIASTTSASRRTRICGTHQNFPAWAKSIGKVFFTLGDLKYNGPVGVIGFAVGVKV